jgi:hypothetical protein
MTFDHKGPEKRWGKVVFPPPNVAEMIKAAVFPYRTDVMLYEEF